MTNNILEKLKAEYTSTPSSSEENQQKKLKLTIDNNAQGQAKDYTNLLLELEEVKKKLIDFEYQKAQYSEIIIENKQRIIELELLNESLLSENNKLKEKLNSRFIDQRSRIESIVEIAQQERKNLYEDIINLIDDQKRFTLDSLLTYSPSEWLAKRNPVIVKFIEALIYNENKDQHKGEKLFKCAMVVDAIYGARNLKYVSAINLAASAIKYSLAKSKTVIDIDKHILSSGSFSKFLKWQESLAEKSNPFPKGLTFMAFDNEQNGQKNYLDHGYNTVTSFVSFNFDPNNQIQALKDPWLYETLNSSQIEELFTITPEIQELLDQQLYNYLSIIICEASEEKNQMINPIDDLVDIHSSNIGKQKRCSKCGMKEIKNLKRNCPQCNTPLPMLSEFQTETQEINQVTSDKNDTKSLIIKNYIFGEKASEVNMNPISITQKSVPEEGVNVPDIIVPDPLPVNPNSIINVRKVLDHIQEISGVNKGERKWIAVVCDGVPYYLAQKIKKDYPGIILLPGPLHEEMNMLKSFVELNWYVSNKYYLIIFYSIYICIYINIHIYNLILF